MSKSRSGLRAERDGFSRFDFHDFDLPEFARVAFGLQADVAVFEHFIASEFGEFIGVGIAAELRFGVGDDFFAIDQVADQGIAVDFDFEGDPLVAVEGFGG